MNTNRVGFCPLFTYSQALYPKGKCKVHPMTVDEDPEVEYRYSSTLSLTSALDGSGWSTPSSGRFTPGKDPVPGGWVGRRVGLDWRGKSHTTGIRSADRPTRKESLYRLRCRGPLPLYPTTINPICCQFCPSLPSLKN